MFRIWNFFSEKLYQGVLTLGTSTKLAAKHSLVVGTYFSEKDLQQDHETMFKNTINTLTMGTVTGNNKPSQLTETKLNKFYLPMRAFNRADFPAFLGPKTKQCTTFLCETFRLRSTLLFLVIVNAEAGSPVYPMYTKFAKLLAGSRRVIRAHCTQHNKD